MSSQAHNQLRNAKRRRHVHDVSAVAIMTNICNGCYQCTFNPGVWQHGVSYIQSFSRPSQCTKEKPQFLQ